MEGRLQRPPAALFSLLMRTLGPTFLHGGKSIIMQPANDVIPLAVAVSGPEIGNPSTGTGAALGIYSLLF